MKIRNFVIKNFKSLENISVNNCQDFHVFIGANSAGKTSVFEAINIIKLLSSKLPTPEIVTGGITDFEIKQIILYFDIELNEEERKNYLLHHFHVDAPRTEKILKTEILSSINFELTINLYGSKTNNQYAPTKIFPSQFNIRGNDGFVRVISYNNNNLIQRSNPSGDLIRETNFNNAWDGSGTSKKPIENSHYMNINSFSGRFFTDLKTNLRYIEAIRETHKKLPSAYFAEENAIGGRGEKLANFMETLWANDDEYYKKIEKFSKSIFPNIEKIRAKKLPTNETIIEIHKKNINVPITLDSEGRGIDQALVVIWRIATSPENTIWLVDEPEIHLHPGAQKLLYEFFQDEVCRNKQIIVSTHSMVFIHRCDEEQISVLLYRDGLTELSSIKNIINAELISEKDRSKIRSLVYKSLGYDSSQSLEYTTIVAVEGKTDKNILKIFAKKLEIPIDEKTVQIIPIGNKNEVERFTPILKYAVSKKTLIILDNDYQNPDQLKQSIKSKENEYMKKIGLEKALLKDEEFCFYDEDVYSIESYLLNSVAIGQLGSLEPDQINEIADKIRRENAKEKKDREKPKNLLANLWSDYGMGQYDDEAPEKIANNLTKLDIMKFPEMVNIIKKINGIDDQ